MSLESGPIPELTWRTSSYSGGQGGDCVEVATKATAGRVVVRDSKDERGPMLSFSLGAWGVFVGELRGGSGSIALGQGGRG